MSSGGLRRLARPEPAPAVECWITLTAVVHLTGTYSDVDHSPDPVGAAEWMDTMCDWPFIRAYKARTVELHSGVQT